MKDSFKVSILIPAYNEERSLPELFKELTMFFDNQKNHIGGGKNIEYEALIINDGSKDSTLKMLQQLHEADSRFNYVSLSRNFGKENAMLAGFDYVTGDCCVIIDADLQHPLNVIPLMIEKWINGADDVYGRRIHRGKESWLRKTLTKMYYKLLQKSTRIEILQNVGDFRLLDKRCVNALKSLRETQRYTKGLYCWIGFKKEEILFEQADSIRGESNFNFKSLFNLAIEGITTYTTAPLRFATFMGVIICILSFISIIWVVIKTLIWGEPIQGFPTLMCTILFLGGAQLLSLGIIGEYLGRIFNETKNRPVYIADEYNGQKI